jgi:serine protease Do
VPLANSDAVRIAETVFAVGNPFGLQHTVTIGIISAKNRTVGQGPFDNFLQTDASINPGNSGGPLFNLKGEVVGINTMIFSKVGQSGGVGFAIPSNEAKALIPDLKRYGRVPRPWLGILTQALNPGIVNHYQLPVSEGIFVTNLAQSAPADSAGINIGDIIVEGIINGSSSKIKEPVDLERLLGKLKPNETIRLKIYRNRKQREITVQLEELPRLDNLPQGII